MDSRWWLKDSVIDVWFELCDLQMRVEGQTPSGARPPSLRDAIYAWALAHRSMSDTSPETIESYVNGVELGAMSALRDAWEKRNK